MNEGAAAIGVGVTAVDLIMGGGGGKDDGGRDGPLSRHATDTACISSATNAPALLVAVPPPPKSSAVITLRARAVAAPAIANSDVR